ncbi:CocE/NonD family hydrolase [uncultured Alsobacter sp.]|uniref:CocE/NonD family hydrolase n=1 Tax=uncultured Alsobacter sp. TaxID=1748258 RepID=UPI00260131EC|nr:CocE/NonD family hydrolase [uncultured Alsobacter sp.]
MAEPRGLLPVSGPHDAPLVLADGVRLAGDLYRPDAPGRFPVLLMRQPYGRRIASTVVLAHPSWYAAHGYIVLVQDVRGRGDSGGTFRILSDDVDDGAASLAFAADLPGSTGQVATYGFSYQAMTQLMALAGALRAGTKRPDAMAPAMGAWSVRDDWAFEGEAFRLAGGTGWAGQMGAEQARLAGDRLAHHALAGVARGTPWTEEQPALPQALAEHGRYAPHYEKWREDDRGAMERSSPAAALAGRVPAIPGLFVGGWADFMLTGTLAMHAAFGAASPAGHRMTIGPWGHIPWNGAPGVLSFGPRASTGIDTESIRFFDHHLKDRDATDPPVRLFDVGLGEFVSYEAWPSPEPTAFHLSSRGLAGTTITDGMLAPGPGEGPADAVVHDPWRPAPAVGGHLGTPGGFADRSAVDERTDVAVYTSAPLPRDTLLAGPVCAALHVGCDRPSHDLHCALSFLPPRQDRAITLTTGALHLRDAGTDGARVVPMRAVCATLRAGTRLRLSVQAAAFPAFPVNPGTGEPPPLAHPARALVTTLHIRHDARHPSRLLLPIAA